jgi:hypothetical protein
MRARRSRSSSLSLRRSTVSARLKGSCVISSEKGVSSVTLCIYVDYTVYIITITGLACSAFWNMNGLDHAKSFHHT